MTTAIYLAAPNDVNGNPRRGWLFTTGERHEFHDEGYEGVQAIRAEYLQHIARNAPKVNVTATEYRRIAKQYR
jgi:hypothetical protein